MTNADIYRRIRSSFIERQHALCTSYGKKTTINEFDIDVRCYLREVDGVRNPTPPNYVAAAREMLDLISRK